MKKVLQKCLSTQKVNPIGSRPVTIRTIICSLLGIYRLLITIVLLVFLNMCSNGWKRIPFEPEKSAAYFDYFSYRGMDDYYIDHQDRDHPTPASYNRH